MGASEIETQKSQGLATFMEAKNQEIEFTMADKLLNEIRRLKQNLTKEQMQSMNISDSLMNMVEKEERLTIRQSLANRKK